MSGDFPAILRGGSEDSLFLQNFFGNRFALSESKLSAVAVTFPRRVWIAIFRLESGSSPHGSTA